MQQVLTILAHKILTDPSFWTKNLFVWIQTHLLFCRGWSESIKFSMSHFKSVFADLKLPILIITMFQSLEVAQRKILKRESRSRTEHFQKRYTAGMEILKNFSTQCSNYLSEILSEFLHQSSSGRQLVTMRYLTSQKVPV